MEIVIVKAVAIFFYELATSRKPITTMLVWAVIISYPVFCFFFPYLILESYQQNTHPKPKS